MPKLPGIEVARPCEESWETMRGDARSRHCEACGKGVLNLAAMTRREVELVALRAAAGEAVCARITRRNGELVMLPSARTGVRAATQGMALTTALSIGLPAFAQVATPSEDGEIVLKEVAPQPEPIPGMATVIGRLLHPDGNRVSAGLVIVRDEHGMAPVYVLDTSGWFELHLKPGTYDFVVRTGEDQFERVPGAVLHEGIQQFADLKTRTGLKVPEADDIETTSGAMVATISGGPRYWFRHPVSYVRYVGYRIRRGWLGTSKN